MPFNLQGKEVLWKSTAAAVPGSTNSGDSVGTGKKERTEPRSVLDHRRSPSPPTSASTGGGSADSTGVAVVSDNPGRKWSPTTSLITAADEAPGRRDEWAAAELLPIPTGLEIGALDWEAMLSEPAAPLPGDDQASFLRCIMGEVEGFSTGAPKQRHHRHQMLPQQAAVEFQVGGANAGCGGGGGGGAGIAVDPVLGFENLPGMGLPGSMAGYPFSSSAPVQPPANSAHLRVPWFGANTNPSPLSSPSPSPASSFPFPLSMPPGGGFFPESGMEEKLHLFDPGLLLNQQQLQQPPPPPSLQCAAFFQPLQPPYQQDMESSQGLPGHRNLLQIPTKSRTPPADEAAAAEEAALVDQLFKAAEMVEAGNFTTARGILARLNHQLSPSGKPSIVGGAAAAGSSSPAPSPALSTPLDVVLKLSAYKSFSEVSPVLQFSNFTCAQALLEELSGCDRIHIVDFEVGVGGQWSSFMQELAQRRDGGGAVAAPPSLRITAFASPENLSNFARELNIPFEINIQSIESVDPASFLEMVRGDEAVAVNLPASLGPSLSAPAALLCLVKQLAPRIVVSVDHGAAAAAAELPLPRRLFHALQSGAVLLDSIATAGVDPDAMNKMEQYLVKPRIQSAVAGRYRASGGDFAAAGFSPAPFSSFAEMQADCLVKRLKINGFHAEKKQAALSLSWRRAELVSVSAWRC
ncbi:unnamed protein product [Spirodela intermedia]|uniref:Uncharacterized protein n=1 Tax=Spirodela intermedia TaxID=51605 RepID=A0A7I8J006_SPIIN|nr:unnamed protein product [Spirodela intermedia]CAA6663302.1 unnamed protein product [Spirodela intermedia]